MTDLDPPGTCHLVGCAGKGVHKVTEPHSLPSDPPRMTEIAVAYPELRKPIGTPDSWAPYEGGPTIPKPSHDRCLGFPVIQMTETGALAYCSIQAGAWSTRMLRDAKYNAGALVDEHNRTCPNRRAR